MPYYYHNCWFIYFSLKDLIPRIPINPDRLFYNRVPKCGSHTFLDVINVMAVNNNFTFERAPEYMSFHVETYYQVGNITAKWS